jgi:hypothetical protein
MANPTSPTASSRTSSLPFTNSLTTIRHLVDCCRESTSYRRSPLSHSPDVHSMRHPVHAIEQSGISPNLLKNSLNQSPSRSSVSTVSKNGEADNTDFATTEHIRIDYHPEISQKTLQNTSGSENIPGSDAKSHRRSRIDTFDLLNPSCNRRPPFRKQSSQAEYTETYAAPLMEPTNEKDIGVETTVTVTSDTLSSGSLSTAEIKPRHRVRGFCLHWFSAYRILIGFTFLLNTAVLIVAVERNRYERSALLGPLIATAANIFAGVLVRQEDLINVSFGFVAKTRVSLPFWLRKIIADFHHYGGLHIGCSISALLWYCYFIFLDTNSFLDNVKQGIATVWMWADIITSYAFLLAILVVCLLAHPRFRIRFHNTFEHTHRFGGWTALLVLWVNAGVASRNPGSPPLYANAAMWLLAGTTFLIILPWTRMRRVPITAEAVSSREVKITFPYKSMPYTSTVRFSLSPLLEWHAFATIPCTPSPTNASAYIVISKAGDWTTAIIESPPTHMWLRKPATKNFLSFAPLFNSLLLVGTGAGIGPLLSLLSSPAIAHMRDQGRQVKVMWCVYDPDAVHWQFVQDIIRNVDPEPKIFDSREGRPDLAFEAAFMREQYGLEAVMVVSNATVTREIVEGVKRKGSPAYGAVFDS